MSKVPADFDQIMRETVSKLIRAGYDVSVCAYGSAVDTDLAGCSFYSTWQPTNVGFKIAAKAIINHTYLQPTGT